MKVKNIIILPILLILGLLTITNVNAAGFNVTRTVTGVSNPVNNTFTYTVTADSSNPAVVTPPANATIAMSGAINDHTATTTVAPLIAESVWTSLNYTDPGTYKFVVRETGTTNSTVYPVDNTTYTVIIHVANEMDGGVPTGNLIKTYVGAQKNGTGTKIDGNSNVTYTSEAVLSKLTITNNLRGDGANTGEYFKYLVTINGNTGDTYTIAGQDSNITYNGTAVTTSNTYTVGGNNYVYLKHGQSVTIGQNGSYNQLPVGVTYSVVQQDSLDYDTFVDGGTTPSKTTGNKTISTNTNTAAFINEKDNPSPTGLFIRIIPFILLVIISGFGIYLIIKNRKEEQKIQK